MERYGARVKFTDGGEDLTLDAETPDKARIEALQKAKLSGRTPEVVLYDTDDEVLAYLYESGQTMPKDVYKARYTTGI